MIGPKITISKLLKKSKTNGLTYILNNKRKKMIYTSKNIDQSPELEQALTERCWFKYIHLYSEPMLFVLNS